MTVVVRVCSPQPAPGRSLQRKGASLSGVVAVRVESGRADYLDAHGRIQSLVVRSLAETRAIIRKHDGASLVPEAESKDITCAGDDADEPDHGRRLRRREALAQGLPGGWTAVSAMSRASDAPWARPRGWAALR